MRTFQVTLIVAAALLATGQLFAGQPQGTVLWTYEAGGPISFSPGLGPDGTVYINAGSMLAITNSGGVASNKWSAPVSGPLAIDAGGTIYVAGSGGLYAINSNGSIKWTYEASSGSGGVVFPPAVNSESHVLFLASGELHTVSATGAKLRTRLIERSAIGTQAPVIGRHGVAYLGLSRTLYAFDPGGSNQWSTPLILAGDNSPCLDHEDTIYCSVGSLAAFSSSGSKIWETWYPNFYGSPVIGKGGVIYAASTGRVLYAVTAQGNVLWNVFESNPQYGEHTAPAVDAAGRIWYCVSNSVWCLNPKGQVEWSLTSNEPHDEREDLARTSPIIGPDGTLYAALGSTLYAIATGTNGPADSPWPMYRGNARHTGRVEKPALSQPKKRADANLEFQLFPHQLGLTYDIQNSTNLATWTSLTSIVAQAFPVDIVDLAATNSPMKFYRAVSSP